jgi:DNA-binding beta-propeller fold protein YncE
VTSTLRCLCALLLVTVLPAAVRAAAPTVTYGAPAGVLPAGHAAGGPYDAVLPSGRLLTPAGRSIVVGMDAQGIALSPDGRFAIVSNGAENGGDLRSAIDPRVVGGSSLAVVDVASMSVVDLYQAANESFFAGVVALRDPQNPARTLVLAAGGSRHAVYAFTLDAAGSLAPDQQHVIPIPAQHDPAYADAGHSLPATMALASDGRHAYVVDELGDAVVTIDVAARKVTGTPRAVGYFPFGVALAGDRLLVTNEGLLRYGVSAAPAAAPAFANPPTDLSRASSLSLVGLGADGVPAEGAVSVNAVAMDQTPDGVRTVGGAHPTAIVATPNGSYAFVAMANVDRIATVVLGASPHVIGGVELRLFDRGPYGTEPTALALSRDGSRLYVALTGLNAIAVIDAHDPVHLRRLGLIPTGWAPSALALSADDRTLYVANAKGLGHDAGFSADPTGSSPSTSWATLQRIDLADVRLVEATRATLAATRRVFATQPVYPKAIRNVVLIVEEDKTFDAMLGDLGYGPAEPSLAIYGENVTPNLHALARRFAVAGNLFADAEDADAGAQVVAAGIATPYTERAVAVANGRAPFVHQNPEDVPRAGYLFHALARHGLTFRDYGGFVRVAGSDTAGAASDPALGLGARYRLAVPAPAVLDGHVDLQYPGPNPQISDQRRAAEFARDFYALAGSLRVPRFTYVSLPGDRVARGPGAQTAAQQVADGDRALGTIVAYISHLPTWRTTAIFVVPASAAGRDHIDEHRSYALVISPYAKRRFVGMRHTSTASVLKTIDGIFGLPPLSLGDLLATDLSDLFTPVADVRPYDAILGAPASAAAGGSARNGEPNSP